MLNKSQVISKH